MPDVNWMLTISSLCSSSSGATVSDFLAVENRRSVNGVVAWKEEVLIRSSELLTSIIFRNDGTEADSSSEFSRSGKIVLRSVIFSLGDLYGRLVSVPIIRCAASKWFKAAITCGALNAGFSGTYSHSTLAFIPIFPSFSNPDADFSNPERLQHTRIAPSLKSAYVSDANSQLFPKLTATRSPFLTPLSLSPYARILLLSSNSLYVNRVAWEREMTAVRSPWEETILAKCWGIVWGRSGG